ncbi:type II secretion system F family protein [Glaciibacter superstes]|uniref:type II secretion system F family protein n=1 Tax=Glaciibacter superstes TaxID=501023 RepID=UPI0003B405A4|nr:type II secretion system F family protein [Glaciibacter superstes]
MLIAAVALLYLATAVVIFGVARAKNGPIPLERRRPPEAESMTTLSRATETAAETISGVLSKQGWSRPLAAALERAGIKMAPAEFLILVASAMFVALLIGFLLGGLGMGLLFCVIGPLVTKIFLATRESRRRKAFANQLDDTLQLLAGGLRAGHSLLRAIDAVSHEAESPTNEEFARVVNETRLGRDLDDALETSAARMRSEDFSWVGQAIAIHREVGGDLSGVLDEVGHTIRERNQMRRQVDGLSAEGKTSAYVLLALPFVVLGILSVTSPTYVAKFVESPVGFGMIAAAVVMLIIGGLWMKKIVSFKF